MDTFVGESTVVARGTIEEKAKMVEGWVDVIGNDWDVYMTVTFRRPNNTEQAVRRFRKLFKYMNSYRKKSKNLVRKTSRSRMLYEKFVRCWVLVEKNPGGEGVHIHALVKGINPGDASRVEARCNRKFGISKVYPYDASKAARYYLARKEGSPQTLYFDYLKINSRARKKLNVNRVTRALNESPC